MVFVNTRNAPLNKKEVRQALYYAMDREELLDKAGFGFGKVSAGPISSEQPVFYTDEVPQLSVRSRAGREDARRGRLSRARPTASASRMRAELRRRRKAR